MTFLCKTMCACVCVCVLRTRRSYISRAYHTVPVIGYRYDLRAKYAIVVGSTARHDILETLFYHSFIDQSRKPPRRVEYLNRRGYSTRFVTVFWITSKRNVSSNSCGFADAARIVAINAIARRLNVTKDDRMKRLCFAITLFRRFDFSEGRPNL